MSSIYRPREIPSSFNAEQQEFLRQEFANIRAAWEAAKSSERLDYRHVAPEKINAGDLVLADGTDWDPGSGVGLYRRNEANSAWVFIG